MKFVVVLGVPTSKQCYSSPCDK